MTVIASASHTIAKQDRGKNILGQNYGTDREISCRYRRASRRRMVNKSEGIGDIDGGHDEGVGIFGTRLWLKIFLPARDPTSLTSVCSDRATPLLHWPDQRWLR